MTASRSSSFRRWLLPLLVLAVAGALTWWSRMQAPRTQEEVRAFVATLLEGDGAAPSGTGAIPGLGEQLQEIRMELKDRGASDRIVVRAGDHPEFGDGTATHTAVIEVNGTPRLGLRLVNRSGKIAIVGSWRPNG